MIRERERERIRLTHVAIAQEKQQQQHCCACVCACVYLRHCLPHATGRCCASLMILHAVRKVKWGKLECKMNCHKSIAYLWPHSLSLSHPCLSPSSLCLNWKFGCKHLHSTETGQLFPKCICFCIRYLLSRLRWGSFLLFPFMQIICRFFSLFLLFSADLC